MTTQQTPQPIDMFSRFMAGMFDEREVMSVPTGFLAFFGSPLGGGKTHYCLDAGSIDIDIIRGNRKTAALIPRGIGRPLGSTHADMQGGKSTTFSRKFPLAEEVGNISADELVFRLAGEPSYNSGKTRHDRLRDKARDLHMEGVRRSARLFEILAMNSVMTGQMPAILGTANTDLIYDFKRRDTHTVTVSNPWTGAVNPFDDLDTNCELMERDSGLIADMFCIGGQAFSAMLNNADFQTLADNRRIEMIQVGKDLPVPEQFARFVASGWTPQGRLRTPKGYTLWVFTYSKTYTAADGTSTKLMDEEKAFITSSRVRCDRYFGPPESLPMTKDRAQLYQDLFGFDPKQPPMPANVLGNGTIIEAAMFHCDAYLAADQKSLSIRTQSAPIFATTMTDGFVVLQGIVS